MLCCHLPPPPPLVTGLILPSSLAKSSGSQCPPEETEPTTLPTSGGNKKEGCPNSLRELRSLEEVVVTHGVLQCPSHSNTLSSPQTEIMALSLHKGTRSMQHHAQVASLGHHTGFPGAFCMIAPWSIHRRGISAGGPVLLPALQGSERGGTRATLSTGVFKNTKQCSAKLQ